MDELFPNPKCELNYTKDYELLIATVLSAQSTDRQVNKVTDVLFKKYSSLKKLGNADLVELENILRPVGSYHKKAIYVKDIANKLVNDWNGSVPKSREALLDFLGIAKYNDDVYIIEKKAMKKFAKEVWGKRHLQIVLFGRYYCKAIKPLCQDCKLFDYCLEKKKTIY